MLKKIGLIMMNATLADVAKRAKVSLATASRVINNSSHNVTMELRERVWRAVEELQYVPNAHARALVRDSTATVGAIVHDVSDPYFAEITRGMQRVATEAGKLMMICNTYRDRQREIDYIDMLRSHRVDAIILAGSGMNDPVFTTQMRDRVVSYIAQGGQVAFIGKHDLDTHGVLPDNYGGAKQVGELLAQFGHKQIAVISGPPILWTSHERLTGFRDGLAAADVSIREEAIVEGDFSRDGGAEATKELLKRGVPFTALFALNDPMAIGALSILKARHIRVPEEVSLIGFDNIQGTIDTTPTLSTVHVPMVEMGAKAVEMILNEPVTGMGQIQFETQLILRQSVLSLIR